MKKWKLITGMVLFAGVFVFAGALAATYYLKSRHPIFIRGPQKARYAYFLKRLNQELGLSAAQNEKIGKIVDQLGHNARQQIEDHQEKMRMQFNRSIFKIREELDPDQQIRFDALVNAFRKSRKKPGAQPK